jgi:hypothetical protein
MPTYDGIKDIHWNKVKSLAINITNVSGLDHNTAKFKMDLVNYLTELETVYGRLPSLLATKAEYIDDSKMQLALLKESYISACEINDSLNKTMISSTIAEFYLEYDYTKDKIQFWKNEFKTNMIEYTDSYYDDLWLEIKNLG